MRYSYETKLHIRFWLLLILLPAIPGMLFIPSLDDWRDRAVGVYGIFSTLKYLIPGSIFFYIFYCFIFPKSARAKVKILLWSGAIIILLALLTQGGLSGPSIGLTLYPLLLALLMVGGISYLVYFINRTHKQKQLHKQIMKQNAESELALLKAQISPHFLFNTLNNIDALIQTNNPEKASEALVTMSDIMRYMTYDSSSMVVPLAKEIEYIESYIHLQMLRLSNQELVDFRRDGEVDGIEIAPMLLIPFVENAFKHASDKKVVGNIKIRLSAADGKVNFSCKNRFEEGPAPKDKTGGVGLINVERRLQLLYPDRHDLEIKKKNGLFEVNLTLVTNEPELHNR